MSELDAGASNKKSLIENCVESLIEYRRLVFSLVLLLLVVGVFALNSMSRQEDPSFPYRVGLLKVFYPGGTPLQIEKLITEPLEEELAQVPEVSEIKSTSRDDLVLINIELQDHVYDTNAAWDRVEAAVERARLQFPEGVSRIELDDRQIDMPAAVLSITGSEDPILLENAALKLKQRVAGLEGLSRIEVKGAPGKEVIVKLDQDTINRLGISRQMIANTLSQRNSIIPGGLVSSDSKSIRINTQSDYASLEELRRTMIRLPSGQLVSLETIADVNLEPSLPLTEQVYQNGARTVSLGVIAQRGQVDVIRFGQELRKIVDDFRPILAPLKIEESFFQPDYVQDRLDGLRTNLIVSVLVITAVVFLAMGWRTGLMVSAVLPVVSIITLGIYNIGGGVFHQMAVIGMVISLGILIDNAIVIVEYIESAVRKGTSINLAIRDAIKLMAKPLFTSTGTTIAAFIPLLMAEGGVGDFTRAVPIMIIISLLVSYLLSILVLPLVSFYWLRDRKIKGGMAFQLTDKIADKCATLVEVSPLKVLLGVGLLLSVSLAMAPHMKQEFFPATDRAQIVIDMEMPNNTPLAKTADISAKLETRILAHESVQQVYRNVGGAGLRFYYNMVGAPNRSYVARFTVNTRRQSDNQVVVDWVRNDLKQDYPNLVLVPRLLGQGPPRLAPIEVRVKNRDLSALHTASQKIKKVLANTSGVTELRSDLDAGIPELKLSIQESAALTFGLQPSEVATAVLSESRGLLAGQFRYDTDPIPIRVRSGQGQYNNIEVVENQYVYSKHNAPTPISQLAMMQTTWSPTRLAHHDYQRTVTVLAQIEPGYAFNQVLAEFKKNLSQVEISSDVQIEYGGDAAASSEANSSIAMGAPLAVGMLLFFMMFQFNSFRRIAIVFTTIPLAAVGVIPGLVLSGEYFGFQSLLGVIALIGIVLNNAIVLIDAIDQSLDAGDDIFAAVRTALEKRTAPILITTATTILGLLPLALSSSTLWPPMAWAIISGLSLSTVLTLVAIPAMSTLLLGKKRNATAPIRQLGSKSLGAASSVLVLSLLFSSGLFADNVEAAEVINLDSAKIIDLAHNNSTVIAAEKQVAASQYDLQASLKGAWAPRISLGGEFTRRDDISLIELPKPFGKLEVSDDSSYVYEAKITQPLFNPSTQKFATRAARLQSEKTELQFQANLHRVTGRALLTYFEALSLVAVLESLNALQDSLNSRLLRISKNVAVGRALRTDLLQVEVELNRVKQRVQENTNSIKTSEANLKQLLNIDVGTQINLVSISDTASQINGVEPSLAELSCFARKDCDALAWQADIVTAQRQSVQASGLPSVSLSLSERRSDGQLFVSEKDTRAMLEFRWAIFSGGQRTSQSRALNERKNAQLRLLESFQRQLQVEIVTAKGSRDNAKSQLMFARSSVELDHERLKLSQTRYDEGLLNIDELLDAQASLASSVSDLARAKIAQLAAMVAMLMATGDQYQLDIR
jgi:multidrug efflux pump subunit AcrB/outer membrane protein TolC